MTEQHQEWQVPARRTIPGDRDDHDAFDSGLQIMLTRAAIALVPSSVEAREIITSKFALVYR